MFQVPRAKRAFEALLSMASNVCGDAVCWVGAIPAASHPTLPWLTFDKRADWWFC